MPKYVFITGGVSSSLGKGIIASSLAKLFQARNFKITIQKLDPYINVDPGTLNPYEHGECYVTEDGAETDLDLGHYERFLNVQTSKDNNVTTGKIYQTVIEKERRGDFLGKTVQVIPHITDEIKNRILAFEKKQQHYDIVITEVGGTVGDIESLPYIEAIRQLQWEKNEDDVVVIHLAYIPYLAAAKELKTKPIQHSVKLLSQSGVQPDIVVCRTEHHLNDDLRKKVALFCNVHTQAVIEAIDASTIYEVPMNMLKEKLDVVCLKKLNITQYPQINLDKWESVVQKIKNPQKHITIGLIGKYIQLQDAYKSIHEAFIHAGAVHHAKIKIEYINSEQITSANVANVFKSLNGILIAPGFGARGIEGKILAAQYARENNVPFLGICLGMQIACIEFALNVLHLKDATSQEFNETSQQQIIHLMEQQKQQTHKGGTMRLGAYNCSITKNSKAFDIYKQTNISERHRHRYEFNNDYLQQFEKNKMVASGKNEELNLVEIMEYTPNTFFVGVQFHPELKSTLENPHPLFVSFAEAALK